MTPIVNGLQEEFEGQAAVLQLNAAESDNVQLMQDYGLRGHPSFAVVNGNGRVTQTFFGPQSEETLRGAVINVLP